MGASTCTACVAEPVMKCGRCTLTRCALHAMRPGERCELCELDWKEEAPTRRAAKLIFAPPIAVLAGGLLFGVLLPITIGGAIGASIMGTLTAGTALGAGAGACRIVDRSARALFLRERAGTLPAARVI